MQVTGTGSGIGFSNAGYWGFPVYSNWTYKGSFYVHGDYSGNISVTLQSLGKESWADADVEVHSSSGAWTQYHYTLVPSQDAPNTNNTLDFTWDSTTASTLDFNLISLFPPTYNNRENGLRIDLMEAMADLNPSFFRAPGGNNLEGLQSPYWWNWTNTIGPLENRVGYPDTWNYQITDGLGLIEQMLWAQDLGEQLARRVRGSADVSRHGDRPRRLGRTLVEWRSRPSRPAPPIHPVCA
jgi:alpha-N-arabinofuranosidase